MTERATNSTRQATDELRSRVVEGPVGPLTLIASDDGLVAVLWPDESPDRVRLGSIEPAAGRHEILDAAEAQLLEYFAGERTHFELPLDPRGTEFQLAVWRSLAEIPYGSTATYGEQARAIGRPSAVRAVGAANGRNPLSIVLPCHRVVGADGAMTGFAGGVETKRFLLEHEGAIAARLPVSD